MKINLLVNENGKDESVQYTIGEVKIKAITNAIKTIRDILDTAQKDENLQNAIGLMMEQGRSGDAEDQDEQQAFGERLMGEFANSIDTLFMEIPEKTIELLANLSGVPYDVLLNQNFDGLMDVYDAVIQENDIDKLVERGKKSLNLTKQQTSFLNKFQPADQKANIAADQI